MVSSETMYVLTTEMDPVGPAVLVHKHTCANICIYVCMYICFLCIYKAIIKGKRLKFESEAVHRKG